MGHYVYKYVLDGECLYIGKTNKDLAKRLRQHGVAGDNISSDHWEEINKADIYFCEFADRHMTDIYETELIRRHSPKFNKAKTSDWSGIDLPEPVWNIYPRKLLETNQAGRPSLRSKDEYDTMKIRQSLQIMKELSKTMRDAGRTAEEIGTFQKDFLKENNIAVPETFIFSSDEGSVSIFFEEFQQVGMLKIKDVYNSYVSWCCHNRRTPVIKRDFTDLVKDGAVHNAIFKTHARVNGITCRNVIYVRQEDSSDFFLRQRVEEVHGMRIVRAELYELYLEFCLDNNLDSVGKHEFYQNVRNHGIRQIKTNGYDAFADIYTDSNHKTHKWTKLIQNFLDNTVENIVCSNLIYDAVFKHSEGDPCKNDLLLIAHIMNFKISGWTKYRGVSGEIKSAKKHFSRYGAKRAWERISANET